MESLISTSAVQPHDLLFNVEKPPTVFASRRKTWLSHAFLLFQGSEIDASRTSEACGVAWAVDDVEMVVAYDSLGTRGLKCGYGLIISGWTYNFD